jgi:hypothetical protein
VDASWSSLKGWAEDTCNDRARPFLVPITSYVKVTDLAGTETAWNAWLLRQMTADATAKSPFEAFQKVNVGFHMTSFSYPDQSRRKEDRKMPLPSVRGSELTLRRLMSTLNMRCKRKCCCINYLHVLFPLS